MKRNTNSSIQDETQLSLNFHNKPIYKSSSNILNFSKAKNRQTQKESKKSLNRILESAKNLTW